MSVFSTILAGLKAKGNQSLTDVRKFLSTPVNVQLPTKYAPERFISTAVSKAIPAVENAAVGVQKAGLNYAAKRVNQASALGAKIPNYSFKTNSIQQMTPKQIKLSGLAGTPVTGYDPTVQKVGGSAADLAFSFAEMGAVGKALKGVKYVSSLQKTLGSKAGKVIAGNTFKSNAGRYLLGKGLANVGQGIPYSLAWQILKEQGLNPKDFTQDTAIDLATGFLPIIGAVAGKTNIDNQAIKQLVNGKKLSNVDKELESILKAGVDVPTSRIAGKARLENLMNYTEELSRIGYNDKQIKLISAKEAQRIFDKNINPNEWAKELSNGDVAESIIKSEPEAARIKVAWNKIFNPIKNAPENVRGMLNEWKTSLLVSKNKAREVALKFADIPEEEGLKLIKYIQTPSVQQAKKLGIDPTKYAEVIQKLRNEYDSLYKEGVDQGLSVGYVHNYLNQTWKDSTDDILKKVAGLGAKPSFANEKVIPNYETGIKLGLTPLYTHPSQIVAHYRYQLDRAIANARLAEDMVNSNAILPASKAPRDWKVLDFPFFPRAKTYKGEGRLFEENYAAPDSIYQSLKSVFGEKEEGLVHVAANVSKFMQDVTMSGGFKSVNAFVFGNWIKEMTAGRVRSPISAFFKSFSDQATKEYFTKNSSYLKAMAEEGIAVRSNAGYESMFKNLMTDKSLKETIASRSPKEMGKWFSQNWDQLFNESTFKRFMPMLEVNAFKDSYDGAIKSGLDSTAARKLAGRTTRAFYGISDNFTRPQFTEDALSAVFFAPRFRESMINFWVNNLKSIKNIKDPAYNLNRRFLVGTIITYALLNQLNKALTGHLMRDNKGGKELSLEIPTGEGRSIYVPILPSIGTLPRRVGEIAGALSEGDTRTASQKVGSFFSQPINLASQLASNRTYYGGPIYGQYDPALTRVGKLAGYAVGQASHPYVASAIEAVSGRKTPFEAVLGAAELPAYPSSSTNVQTATAEGLHRKLAKADYETRVKILAEAKQTMTKEQWTKVMGNLKKLQLPNSERALLSASVSDRASYMDSKMKKMTYEQRVAFLKDMKSKGLLTSAVSKELISRKGGGNQ